MVCSATELLLSHSILHPSYHRKVNLFEIEYLGVKKAAKSAKSLLTEHRYYYSCHAGTAATMHFEFSGSHLKLWQRRHAASLHIIPSKQMCPAAGSACGTPFQPGK